MILDLGMSLYLQMFGGWKFRVGDNLNKIN